MFNYKKNSKWCSILNVEFRYKLYSIEPRIDLLTDDSGRGPSAGDLAAKTGSLNPVILRYGSLNPVILRYGSLNPVILRYGSLNPVILRNGSLNSVIPSYGSLNPVIPRYRQEPYRTGRILNFDILFMPLT